MTWYQDVFTAIRLAWKTKPAVVGWYDKGWVVFDPTKKHTIAGVEPEFLVFKAGILPLSQIGIEVVCSLMRDAQEKLETAD